MKNTKSTTAQNIDSRTPDTNLTRPQRVKLFILKRCNLVSCANTTWAEKIKLFYRNRIIDVSFPLKALIVWSLFEILLCFIVLCSKNANNVENFISSICRRDGDGNHVHCAHFLEKALFGRMILSTVSIVGIFMVWQFGDIFIVFFFDNCYT